MALLKTSISYFQHWLNARIISGVDWPGWLFSIHWGTWGGSRGSGAMKILFWENTRNIYFFVNIKDLFSSKYCWKLIFMIYFVQIWSKHFSALWGGEGVQAGGSIVSPAFQPSSWSSALQTWTVSCLYTAYLIFTNRINQKWLQ